MGGVSFEQTSSSKIRMEGGHIVQKILDQRIVGRAGKEAIKQELQRVKDTMASQHWAHCDIKPSNVAVKFLSQDLTRFKVFLIDNDWACRYGEPGGRPVYTPGENGRDGDLGAPVDAHTDDQGWEYVMRALS
eukprot:NODE_2049_length_519_cov_210.641414_g2034_i0.p1 GENE.NODE_2049_length_519_cov_210.641414_g2034_i0~~NODE_2049_length_519_cov_210.641414_g2034_i0.p1  ORF type:complete len:132 (-),score=14.92 NODE_2049_length_519_cov_210.641414_g2034_i0:53-448(-)